MEFEELGFGNRDGFCPHCGEFYGEDQLENLLSLEENTDFQCRKCANWIRGFGDFSFTGDIEYHLIAIKPDTSAGSSDTILNP
ncbi:MAG: hypothetical protein PHI97_20450 [Desulfobulbus sp.]|nr:hypothetical protein [Desulfobulbus sp.]